MLLCPHNCVGSIASSTISFIRARIDTYPAWTQIGTSLRCCFASLLRDIPTVNTSHRPTLELNHAGSDCAMESLSLSEDQSYSKISDWSRRCRSSHQRSRLPTPETSSSSHETLESDSVKGKFQTSPEYAVYLEPSRHDRITHLNELDDKSHSALRRDSRNPSTPESPPCPASDAHRPSLPPLKTVGPRRSVYFC